jgi:hypothetical protein
MTHKPSIVSAIALGGALAALFDAADAIVAFRLALGIDATKVYQFVASGMLGPAAFTSGSSAVLLGVAVHCLVAFSAAAVFVVLSTRFSRLLDHPLLFGALHGIGLYFVMNHVVIPLSKIPPSPFSLPLFVNGVVGHALLVGIPIALSARHFLRPLPSALTTYAP